MATYEQYMNAARNADAAGDEAAARQLVQAALEVRDKKETSKEPESSFKLGSLKENIFGEGEVDTIGEYIGDIIGTGAAGALRGIKGLLELPEMAGRAIGAGYDLATGAEEVRPILDTATGRGIDAAYKGIAGVVGADPTGLYRQGESMPAQFAGTIGEFTGGAGALGTAGFLTRAAGRGIQAASGAGNLGRAGQAIEKAGRATEAAGTSAQAIKSSIYAGAGSEAAGQLTEGTDLEPVARIIGAFAGPAAIGSANKTVTAMTSRAQKTPTVDAQFDAARAAYKEVDNAGIKFTPSETDDIINNVERMIMSDDAFAGYSTAAADISVNKHITDARKLLISKTGTEFTLPQLMAIRRDLKNIYRAGTGGQYKFDPRIEKIIDVVDDAMDAKTSVTSGETGKVLIEKANALYQRAKKSELLEDVMLNAELSAASAGSGGNVVNRYRQAVASILKNKSKRGMFKEREREVMEAFVRGSLPENAMRLIGKLSPTGNGLMAALNIGAFLHNPAMLFGTATGFGAKVSSDIMAKNAMEQIKRMIATGTTPEKRKLISDKEIRTVLGLQAGQEQ